MNAQRRWKLAYIRWCTADSAETRSHAAHAMSRFNREAALERKLEAANRRIAALEFEIYNSQEKADRLIEELKEIIIDQNKQRIEKLEEELEEYQIHEYQTVFPLGD